MAVDAAQGLATRTARIVVTLKPGVLDAPGQAILQGVEALGYAGVQSVRAGKYFELRLAADGRIDEQVRRICDGFLANTLIEDYRYEVV